MVNERPAKLIDCRTQQVVEAVLKIGLSAEQILDVESAWGPVRLAALVRLRNERFSGVPLPDHWHWIWARKVPKLALKGYLGVGISRQDTMQGLMLVARAGYESRLPMRSGDGLIYIDYLESAPWNVQAIVGNPQYKASGMALLRAAIEISYADGFEGRVGLHSLPQACPFYERAGFVSLGVDANYEGLPYYELTNDVAALFLSKGESK